MANNDPQRYVNHTGTTLYKEKSDLVSVLDGYLTVQNTADNPVSISVPAYQTDLFGKITVSNSHILGSLLQVYDNNPLLIDTATNGAGASASHSTNTASTTMTTGTSSGSYVIRQSKRYYQYKTAHALRFYCSFNNGESQSGVVKRIGAFDDKNGAFFEVTDTDVAFVKRSYVTGSAVDTRYVQGAWSNDQYSELDLTKTQLLFIEWAWLGVDGIRWGFVVDGVPRICHEQFFSNVIDAVYMSTPNLPIRYEVRTTEEVAEAGVLEQICGSAVRLGGDAERGIAYSALTGIANTTTATTTARTALSVRLKDAYIRARLDIGAVEITNLSSNEIEWRLVLNPTVTGTFTWADDSQIAQKSLSQLTYTEASGTVIASGYLKSTAQTKSAIRNAVDNYLAVVANIAGTSDILSLVVDADTGTNNIRCVIDLLEVYI